MSDSSSATGEPSGSNSHCETCGQALSPHVCEGQCPNCCSEFLLAPSKDVRIGFHYGPYEIVDVIAMGGMGAVYRARHQELGRTVALKLVRGVGPASNETEVRFHREAKAVAQLNHRHIVPIYEIGEVEGECYFAMRLIDGPPLNQHPWNRETREDFARMARVMAKTADAVHYAHQHGILHRDIKPGNVLLDADGEPFLTDFGLARFFEEGSDVTQTNAIVGTPHYMSPEQIEGPAEALTSTADVYGLGAILYELTTGEPPFLGGNTMAVLRNVLEDAVPSPRDRNRNIPRDLDTIISRAMSKRPSDRYASASEFAADLRRFAEGHPILARKVTTVERLGLFIQRRPKVAGLAASLILLLLALAIGSPLIARHQFNLRQSAETAQANAETLSTELLHKNYQSVIQLTQALIDGGRAHLAPPLLWRTDVALRGWEWGFLMAQCPTDLWTYEFGPSLGELQDATPDGNRIYVTSTDAELICIDRTRRTARWQVTDPNLFVATLDPSSRYLATSRRPPSPSGEVSTKLHSGIAVLDALTGKEITSLELGFSSRAHWSSDGRYLYAFSNDGNQNAVTCYAVGSFEQLWRKEFAFPHPLHSLNGSQLTEDDASFVGVHTQSRKVYAIPIDNPSEYEVVLSSRPGSAFNKLRFLSSQGPVFHSRNRQVIRRDLGEAKEEIVFDSPRPIRSILVPRDQRDAILVSTAEEAYLIQKDSSQRLIQFPDTVLRTMELQDGTLLTSSRSGVLRIHNLDQNLSLTHTLQANPGQGSAGRQVEMNEDGSSVIFQSWSNRAAFLGRSNGNQPLAFQKLNFKDLGHVRNLEQVTRSLPIFRPGRPHIVTRTDRSIRFFSVASTVPTQVKDLPVGQEPIGVRFDRTGDKLVYTVRDRMEWADLKTNERQTLIPSRTESDEPAPFPIGGKSLLHFQSDGHYAAVVDEGRIRVCSTKDGSVRFETASSSRTTVCLHPSEPLIAYAPFIHEEPIVIYDFEAKKQKTILSNHRRNCLWMRFSPDGSRLFVNSSSPGMVVVWDWQHDLELLKIPNESGAWDGHIAQNGRVLGSTDYRPALQLRYALPWHYEYATSEFLDAVAALKETLSASPLD